MRICCWIISAIRKRGDNMATATDRLSRALELAKQYDKQNIDAPAASRASDRTAAKERQIRVHSPVPKEPGQLSNRERLSQQAERQGRTAESLARAQMAAAPQTRLSPAGMLRRVEAPDTTPYSLMKSIGGLTQKGIGAAAQGFGDTLALGEDVVLAPFELFSGQELGALSDNAPFNTWAKNIRRENENVAQYYQTNMDKGGTGARLLEELGSATIAATPQAVLAMLTGGTSAAAQTAQGVAQTAARELAPGTLAVVTRAVGSMAKDPQYWTAFSQVAGSSYEDALADGTSRPKAALYAVGNGLFNAAVEVGGGIQTLPAELRQGGNALRAWIDSTVDEGKEEVVQGVIERALQNGVYGKGNPLVSVSDPSAVFNPATSAREFAGGAVVSGILGGGQMLASKALNVPRRAQAQEDVLLNEVRNSAGQKNAAQRGENAAVEGSQDFLKQQLLGQQKTASETEAVGGNLRLSETDVSDYLKTGKHKSTRDAKQQAVNAGEQIVLTSPEKTKAFIDSTLQGGQSNTPRAYGKVGEAMADEVFETSDGAFDVEGWYLELIPSDLRHAFEQHKTAKHVGNIDLSKKDFLNIPDYIDGYDDILSCKTYSNGDKEILLGKKINGYSVIVEIVSNERKSLHFKNMWGVDTSTYENQYQKRSPASRPGRSSVSANDPTRAYHSASFEATLGGGQPGVQASSSDASSVAPVEGMHPLNSDPTIAQGADSVKNDPLQSRLLEDTIEESPLLKQLSEEEQGALRSYKSSESYKLNAKLREGAELSPQDRDMVRHLDSALSRLPTYQGRVYRNLIFDDVGGKAAYDSFLATHIEDVFISYNAYTSVSTSSSGYPVEGTYVVRLVIDSTTAKNAEGFGNNFEQEAIYGRDHDFFVDKVVFDGNGVPTIYMQEAVQNGTRDNGQLHSQERGVEMRAVQALHQADADVRSIPGGDSKRGAGRQSDLRGANPEGAVRRDDSLGSARAGFTTPGMEGTERVSRLQDSLPYDRFQGEATGMSREDYAKLFRYESQTEGRSMSLADDLLYLYQDGERRFIKDVDEDSYHELVESLKDATAWNAPQTDAAELIRRELQGRAVNLEIDSGEYADWLDIMRQHATASGQGVQAYSKWSRAGAEGRIEGEAEAWDNLQKSKLSQGEKTEVFQRILQWNSRIESTAADDTGGLKEIILDVARQRGVLNGLTGKQSTLLQKIAGTSLDSMSFDQLKSLAYASTSALSTDLTPANVGQKLKTIQILNMLSSPKTAAKNIAGNTTFYGIDAAAMRGAAILDMALSKLTGTRSVAFEQGPLSRASREAALKAMQMAAAEITLDVNMDGAQSRYGTAGNRTFKAGGSLADRVLSALERNQAYLLNATDELYKGAARSTAQRTQALVDQGRIKTTDQDYAAKQAE